MEPARLLVLAEPANELTFVSKGNKIYKKTSHDKLQNILIDINSFQSMVKILTFHRTSGHVSSCNNGPCAITVEKRVCDALFLTAGRSSTHRVVRFKNSSIHRVSNGGRVALNWPRREWALATSNWSMDVISIQTIASWSIEVSSSPEVSATNVTPSSDCTTVDLF